MQRIIIALRGRILDKNAIQTRGNYTQVIEPNYEGLSNTITSVQKDNMVLEIYDKRYRGNTDKSQ